MPKGLICTPCWDGARAEVWAVAYAFAEGICEHHAYLLAAAVRRMWSSVAVAETARGTPPPN